MPAKRTAHVISHTHWDREWYLSFEQHRLRLVRLIDRLLNILDTDERFRYFHLDGQTIVLEDYLAIRPHEEARLRKYIEAGRILIGPWYMLQDGFLVTGESHVRNMIIGMEMAREYGSPMMIGYFPDTFGNFSQAPQLLAGFGIDMAVFGRGIGDMVAAGTPGSKGKEGTPRPSELLWQSPDGSEVLAFRMANWYNNADGIPAEPEAGVARVQDIAAKAGRYTDSRHLLFMNGCDHTPVQSDIGAVIETLNPLLDEVELVHSTLPKYAAAIKAEDRQMQVFTGELRDWDSAGWNTLDATLSSRLYLKQWNYRCERLLTGGVEALGAMAMQVGGSFDRDVWRYAWKLLMENHPHDSICGCSIDEVHRDMVNRFERVSQVAEAEIDRRLAELTSAIAPSDLGADRSVVVVNTNGVTVAQHVRTVVDFAEDCDATEFRVTDADGNEVPASCRVIGVQPRYHLPEGRFREVYNALAVEVEFVADVPPLGWHAYRVSPGKPTAAVEIASEDAVLENEHLRVKVATDGALSITDKASGHTYAGMNVFENVGDVGDEYRHIAPKRQTRLTTSGLAAEVGAVERNGVRQSIEIVHWWDVPASATKDACSDDTATMTVRTQLTLDTGARYLAVHVDIDNPATDHRVRALFPTDLATDRVKSSAPFDVVERPIEPLPTWENPSYLQPNDGFITIADETNGLTIATRGLPEFEVYRDGRNTVGLTLLRCSGEIGDWFPFPTPEAQCVGANTAEYAIIPHAADADPLPGVQAYRNPLWVTGIDAGDGSLPARGAMFGVDAPGAIVSACKPAQESDDVVLRLWNTRGEPVRATVTPHVGIGEAWLLNMDETPRTERPGVSGGKVAFTLGPKQIVTLGLNLKQSR